MRQSSAEINQHGDMPPMLKATGGQHTTYKRSALLDGARTRQPGSRAIRTASSSRNSRRETAGRKDARLNSIHRTQASLIRPEFNRDRPEWHSVKGETLIYQWLALAGRRQDSDFSEAARLAFVHLRRSGDNLLISPLATPTELSKLSSEFAAVAIEIVAIAPSDGASRTAAGPTPVPGQTARRPSGM
jgi:hypothetical protein